METRKLITVVGATSSQGGSVVDHISANRADEYIKRAVTSNPQSDAAQALVSRGIEVNGVNANDLASLTAAFKGSYAIFAVTDFWAPFAKVGKEEATAGETKQGLNMAEAAMAIIDTLEHYIWSTLPEASRISGGRE